MTPLVSVLVPVYNTAPYLRECLDSIAGQTYSRLQIVLLDDGSTDSSPEICREYAAKDSRIECHSIAHSGVATARNRLLELARGQYTLFVDSDDWLLPGAISLLVSKIEDEKLDVLMFGSINVGDNLEAPFIRLDSPQAIDRFVKDGKISSVLWAKLVRTAIYKQLSFEAHINCGEDVLMTWRLLNTARAFGIISDRLYFYRDTPGGIINTPFGEDKYSLHKPWGIIAEDCEAHHPHLSAYARRHQAHAYVWALYDAIRAGHPRDPHVQALQQGMKNLLPVACKKKEASIRYKCFSALAAYAYTPLKFLLLPFRGKMAALR